MQSNRGSHNFAPVAQRIERRLAEPKAEGSNPSGRACWHNIHMRFSRTEIANIRQPQ